MTNVSNIQANPAVRMALIDTITVILHDALEKALWCSGDPVRIESHGQGLDSCNLADRRRLLEYASFCR